MVIGTVIQVAAFGPHKGFLQFMIGRVITGVGNGMNTSTIPSWVAECSKSHNRGFLVCIEASMVAVGTLISYWIDFGLSYVDSSVSWRVSVVHHRSGKDDGLTPSFSPQFPIALQVVFAVMLAWGIWVLPESPRWLFQHGHEEAASQIVADLRDENVEDEDCQREIRLIVDGINAAAAIQGGASTRELFIGGKKQHFRRMAVGASSQIFQQVRAFRMVVKAVALGLTQNARATAWRLQCRHLLRHRPL